MNKAVLTVALMLAFTSLVNSQIKGIALNKKYLKNQRSIKTSRNNYIYYDISKSFYNIKGNNYQKLVLSYYDKEYIGYIRISNDSILFIYKYFNEYISNPCSEIFNYHEENLLFVLDNDKRNTHQTYIIDLFDFKNCKIKDYYYLKELKDTIYNFDVSKNDNLCLEISSEEQFELKGFWFSKKNGFLGFYVYNVFEDYHFTITNKHIGHLIINDK